MAMQNQAVQNLAARLVVGLEGIWPTDEEWAWLNQWHPFGVILFSRNVQNFSQLQTLCAVLREAVPHLQMMADHEGGPVSQLAAAVGRPPVAYGLGVLDDVDLTCRVHEETGRRLKAVGLDWVLAPCADVLSEPRNPVIGARSFGSDPQLVARHVAAAVKGLHSGGIKSCLKHWPGHGGASTDSHLESTHVEISDQDEIPFRAGLAGGAKAIMPGHLMLEGNPMPATLSRDFLDDTRRRLAGNDSKLKFIADDVSMGALREPMARLGVKVPDSAAPAMVQVETLPLEWFEKLADAGCDLFLIRSLPMEAFPCRCDGVAAPLDSTVQRIPIVFNPESYDAARQNVLPQFISDGGDLACLDLARDDRWQVAGALDARHWVQWDALWEEYFSSVMRVSGLEHPAAGDGAVSRLLVMNHRPMPENWAQSVWGKSIAARLAATGRCLVMGHPSLKKEFQLFFANQWDVTQLYDVSCDVLGVS